MSEQGLARQSTALTDFNPFRAMDRLDDEQILNELEGRVSKVWVYQFQQDGKTIEGLSKVGVDQACIEMSMRGEVIREGDLDYQQDPTDPKYMLFSAYASKYAVSKEGQEIFLDRVLGTKRQCVYIITRNEGVSDRVNPFWYEQGAMKAMRNARMRLIGEDTRAKIITLAKNAGKTKSVMPSDDIGNGKNGQKPPMAPPQEKKDYAIKDPDAPASDAQIKAISAMWGKLGLEDNLKYSYCTEAAGMEKVIESTKELTKGAASKVIDRLNRDLEAKKEQEG
jgi:hypothetical protein